MTIQSKTITANQAKTHIKFVHSLPKSKSSKQATSPAYGRNGNDGANGIDGFNGAKVFVKADSFLAQTGVTFETKGQDGQNGQDGQDGSQGSYGNDGPDRQPGWVKEDVKCITKNTWGK